MLMHDLQSPHTAIKIFAGVLRDEIFDREMRQDVMDILESADLAGAMIESMSSLLDLEEGDQDYTWFPLDAVELIRLAVDRPALRRHVRLDLPHEITMSGDHASLLAAFTDMIVNARRLAEQRTVHITSGEEPGFVQIRIHHPPPGLPEDLWPRLFELYGTVDVRRGRYTVSAAGLVYARMVVEKHGGTLTFEAAPDGGTDLVVRIPR
jgi:signal transduction histidine kinase